MAKKENIGENFEKFDKPTQQEFREWIDSSVVDNQIILVSPDQLVDPIDNIKYLGDGIIDMGTTSFQLSEGVCVIEGLGSGISKLISSAANYTMFTFAGDHSGSVTVKDVDICVTGTNSKVFDLNNKNNGGALMLDCVQFILCKNIGDVCAYESVVIINGTDFENPSDGLMFHGTFNAIEISNRVRTSLGAGVTLFQEGIDFIVDSLLIASGLIALDITSTSTVFDFRKENFTTDSGFSLIEFTPNTNSNPVPNILSSDPKANFRRCLQNENFINTNVGAIWVITTEVETEINTIGVPVKVAGVTNESEVVWMVRDSDNSVKYNSSKIIDVDVTATLSFFGSNNNQLKVTLMKFQASINDFVPISKSGAFTLNNAGRKENITVIGSTSLAFGDMISVFAENDSSTNNITCSIDSALSIQQRN